MPGPSYGRFDLIEREKAFKKLVKRGMKKKGRIGGYDRKRPAAVDRRFNSGRGMG